MAYIQFMAALAGASNCIIKEVAEKPMRKRLLATLALLALAAPANATICWNGVCGPSKEIIQFDKNAGTYSADDILKIDGSSTSTAGNVVDTLVSNGSSGLTITSMDDPINPDTSVGAGATLVNPIADINPLPAVPEASTWAMMILGFLSVGVMGLRQRLHRRT
jgi:hypothetical protein